MIRTLPRVMKEVRALFPLWLASVVAVGLRALVGHGRFGGETIASLGVIGYVGGSLALGAQSIGHEYSDRTLWILLAQPSDRRRLLLTKLGVSAVMLVTLNAVMWSIPSHQVDFREVWSVYGPELLILGALFVAPWLTMVCRSALAGIVFTATIPGLLWTVSAVFFLARDGATSGTRSNSVWMAVWMSFGVCAVAAIAMWRMFMRLEAIEGRGAELTLPRWLRGRSESTSRAQTASSRTRSPVWMLVKKELHLQQMTFVIAALYILCWATAALMERFVPDFPVDFPLLPITILYFALLSIVIGSLASAEERQFGTLEWQVLLPMPMWRQWMVKVAVVIGLALVLGVAMPMALTYVHISEDVRVQGAPLWRDRSFVLHMSTAVVLLTVCGLYLSSWSTSGVRALVLSIPVTFAGAAFLPYIVEWAAWITWSILKPRGWGRPRHLDLTALVLFASNYFWVVVLGGLFVLLLWFALQNHRRAERSVGEMLRQGMWIAGLLTVAVLLLAGVETFMRTRFY